MISLIAPCTVSFKGSDLGRFDRDTEIKLDANVIVKNFTKTKSSKVIKKRNVYSDVVLSLTTQFDKASYDIFIAATNGLTDEGTTIIDSEDFNITITNMSLEVNSFMSFGGKARFTFGFNSLDKFAEITIIEK